jgi:hypothetical protein
MSANCAFTSSPAEPLIRLERLQSEIPLRCRVECGASSWGGGWVGQSGLVGWYVVKKIRYKEGRDGWMDGRMDAWMHGALL